MSEEFDNVDDDAPDHIKKLRSDAEKGRKLESLVAEKDRQIAFLQAGVDTTSKLGQMLMKSYEGELTAEAIKTEAEEIGMFNSVPAEVVEENPAPTQAQVEYQMAREGLSGGNTAMTEEPAPRSAVDKAFNEWNESRKNGLSNADAQDLAFASFISSAAQGDQTAMFNENDWRTQAANHGHG
jgi:hypothetical protein